MKGATTEYRESYCWIQGSIRTKKDGFDDMIRNKIEGTYKESQKEEKPKYELNVEDCYTEKTPKPKSSPPIPIQDPNSNQEQQQKSYGRKSLISNRKNKQKKGANGSSLSSSRSGSNRSVFCNYGNGNTTRLNPKFNLTSYNIGADDGVNPNTITRNEGRNYALSKYGRPPETSVRVYRPGFFESPNQAPEAIRSELEGPFWVSWPQNTPVPDEYAEIRHIVENQ